MTWRRRDRWVPDDVDPGQLPLAIVCPDRNWGIARREIEAENPPYPVILIRPLQRVMGLELRGYEYRHISNEEYESEAVHQWEHVALNCRVVRPVPTENHHDHTHIEMLDQPRITYEEMIDAFNRSSEALQEQLADDLEERVFQEPGGILSAIDTSNVAESSDDELTEETLREAIREIRRLPPPRDEIPEWQVQIIQAMMEGRTLIVSRGRGHELRQLLEWLADARLAGDAQIMERDIVPESSVIVTTEESVDIVMASLFADRLGGRQQVPDEITDADRQRWANELETTPMPDVGQDSGQGVSSDELLEAIGEAVTEWEDVRDGD